MNKRLYINDKLITKYGEARIECIDLFEAYAFEGDSIRVKSIWSNLRDRCIFNLDNNHWVYGAQIEDT